MKWELRSAKKDVKPVQANHMAELIAIAEAGDTIIALEGDDLWPAIEAATLPASAILEPPRRKKPPLGT